MITSRWWCPYWGHFNADERQLLPRAVFRGRCPPRPRLRAAPSFDGRHRTHPGLYELNRFHRFAQIEVVIVFGTQSAARCYAGSHSVADV